LRTLAGGPTGMGEESEKSWQRTKGTGELLKNQPWREKKSRTFQAVARPAVKRSKRRKKHSPKTFKTVKIQERQKRLARQSNDQRHISKVLNGPEAGRQGTRVERRKKEENTNTRGALIGKEEKERHQVDGSEKGSRRVFLGRATTKNSRTG